MKYIFIIALAIAAPVVGYLVMYAIPISETNIFYHVAYTIILTLLGLCIPYLMLKFAMHGAHIRNPQEHELEISDIPKDQDQLVGKFKAH